MEQERDSVQQHLLIYLSVYLTFYKNLTPAWLACFVNFCAEDNSVHGLGRVLPERFAAQHLRQRGVSQLKVHYTTTEHRHGAIGHKAPCSKFCEHLFPTRAEAQIQLIVDSILQ